MATVYVCTHCGVKDWNRAAMFARVLGKEYYFCCLDHANTWIDNRSRFFELKDQPKRLNFDPDR